MGELLLTLLPLAVVGAVSPLPIVGCTLMLGSARPLPNALAYLAAQAALYLALGALLLALADPRPGSHGNPTADVVVGGVLLAVALHQALVGIEVPRWLEAVDRARPRHAAGVGAAVAAINLKSLALVVSGGGEIARADIEAGGRAVALALLVAGISAGVAAAIGLYVTAPTRGAVLLARLRAWLERRGRWVLVAVCTIAGTAFLMRGLLA